MDEQIRITDLAQPLRSEMQLSALAYAETLQIELTSQSVLQEASQATGLEDFGPPDFLAGLELLCDEWSSDTSI